MADRITLEVMRYRPEQETEPVLQSYEVPLRADWAVLDGLNHVKDNIDGTLSYRWSCRMGICGSCGMTVNGEPKLTCAAFLTDYAPGPVRAAAAMTELVSGLNAGRLSAAPRSFRSRAAIPKHLSRRGISGCLFRTSGAFVQT